MFVTLFINLQSENVVTLFISLQSENVVTLFINLQSENVVTLFISLQSENVVTLFISLQSENVVTESPFISPFFIRQVPRKTKAIKNSMNPYTCWWLWSKDASAVVVGVADGVAEVAAAVLSATVTWSKPGIDASWREERWRYRVTGELTNWSCEWKFNSGNTIKLRQKRVCRLWSSPLIGHY